MSALLAGQSVSDVARQFQLSRNTVKAWRASLGIGSPKVDQQKAEEFGDLIARYLRENLTTLAVQAEQFRDTVWLKAQPASEAAVLHGVLTDKAIRLLEALQSDDEAPHAGNAGGSGDPAQ
jgi:hypothetical protein